MKIDNQHLSQVSSNGLQKQGGVGELGGAGGSRSGGKSGFNSDSVELSNLGSALRDLAVEDSGRAQSIGAIQASVDAGTYQVDSRALSRKILEEITTA